MIDNSISPYKNALKNAFKALHEKDRKQAILWTKVAIAQKPSEEDPWLLMAFLASPDASIEYLEYALKLNPNSDRAQKGLQWAQDRLILLSKLEQTQKIINPELLEITQKMAVKQFQPIAKPSYRENAFHSQTNKSQQHVKTKDKLFITAFFVIVLIIFAALFFWFKPLDVVFGREQNSLGTSNPVLTKHNTSTSTPKPSSTPTKIPTYTSTTPPTNTPTSTPTETPTATPTPTYTSTSTPNPTETPQPTQVPEDTAGLPPPHSSDHRWIEIDLSEQRVTAYVGASPVKSFIVSTGTSRTPTVTGEYNVYLMYRYKDMSGPGYNLKDVPNTLYFYQGYAIHGTYWHDNFGTPMSHGCVNMTIEDSAWIYDFAVLGTTVYVKN